MASSYKFRVDTELSTAFLRVVAILPIAVVIWSDSFFAANSQIERLSLLRPLSLAVMATAAAILASNVIHPKSSPFRCFISIFLDCTAVGGCLYLGESALAPVAAFYLWTMLGSGFVFGIRYLYLATVVSTASFGLVYAASPYWQANIAFSLTIVASILLLTPYLASLLTNLYRAKRTISWQANHDVLTGVLNRRAFKAQLSEILRSSNRKQHLLLFCDLDEFKAVNDQAGHAAGDKVLQDVAKIFQEDITKYDLVGRLGGDEFCILLNDTTLDRGRTFAERVRNGIASYRLGWANNYFCVSISIGIASSVAVRDVDSLVRLADAACYAAKNRGRNQVHIVDPRVDALDTKEIRNLSYLHRPSATTPTE